MKLIHVTDSEDKYSHDLTEDQCPCKPIIKYVDRIVIITHNASADSERRLTNVTF